MNLEIVSPESVGIPSAALLKLMQRLSGLEYLNSFILMRHGKRCLECFVKPYSPEQPHQLYSLSKSFTSCAIGLAASEGKLKISDKLTDFFPEYAGCITDDRMRKVTLRDLLTMRSGHLTCATKYCNSDDWVRDYLASPLDTAPGVTFTYNSAASYMLAAVIHRVTGENVREYLLPRLFIPMGMMPGPWECCPKGINYGGWGLYLTTDDIAKFAQLLLQHGNWEGKQLLPADYLAEATTKQADNSMNTQPDWRQGYGYHFWRSRHGYRGDGAAGQYAIVLEKEDVAIAVTSCMPNMGNVLNAIWEELLPALSDAPLPEDPATLRELNAFAQNMSIPIVGEGQGRACQEVPKASSPLQDVPRASSPLPNIPPKAETVLVHPSSPLQNIPPKAETPPVHPSCSCGYRVFAFQPNTDGITQCTVAWNHNECSLTFMRNNQPEQLRAGFGRFVQSILQLTDERPHPTAAFAEWTGENQLKITTFITDGIFRDVWTIDLLDEAEPIKNTILCACFRKFKAHWYLQ